MKLNKCLFNRVNNKERERGQRSVVWLKRGQPYLHHLHVLSTVFSWCPFSSFSLWIILLPPSLPPLILPLLNQCEGCLVSLAWGLTAGGRGFASHGGATLSRGWPCQRCKPLDIPGTHLHSATQLLKPCLTKQFLNVFKLWFAWGISFREGNVIKPSHKALSLTSERVWFEEYVSYASYSCRDLALKAHSTLGSDKMCIFVGGCSYCPSQTGLASRRHYWSPVVLYSYTGMEQRKKWFDLPTIGAQVGIGSCRWWVSWGVINAARTPRVLCNILEERIFACTVLAFK